MEMTIIVVLSIGLGLIPLSVFPFFADFYTSSKWLVVYLIAGILFLISLTDSFSVRVSLKSQEAKFLIIAWIGYLVSLLLHWPIAYEQHLLDWIVFSIISLSVMQVENLGNLFKWLALSNLISIYIVFIESVSISTFGNDFFGVSNMTAEFFGLSFLFQWGIWRLRGLRDSLWWIRIVALGICSFCLVYYRNRASILGVLAAIVLYALFSKKYHLKLKLPLLLLLIFGFAFFSYPFGDRSKIVNSEIRLIRWANTLELIKRHPFGVGPGNFEFGYSEVHRAVAHDPESREELIVKSPHNGYLELMAENGIFYFFIFMAAILLLIRLSWRGGLEKINDPFNQVSMTILIFVATDAIFAFPMELGFPFYLATIAFAILIKKYLGQMPGVPSIQLQRPILAVFAFASFFYSIQFGYSQYSEYSGIGDLSSLTRSCSLFSYNWKACLSKAETEMMMGNSEAAEKTIFEILNRNPRNYIALRRLSDLYFSIGDHARACATLKEYRAIFKGTASGDPAKVTSCSL